MKTRFYKYYFAGLEKPIIMEAENRELADQMLNELQYKSQTKIDINKLIDMRVETPLVGISERKRKGNMFVWVGKDKTTDGWLLKEEYDRINNLNNK